MLFNATKLLEKMKTAKPPPKQQFNAVSSIQKSPQNVSFMHTPSTKTAYIVT